MNKNGLIENVARATKMSKPAVAVIVESMFEIIKNELESGGSVKLVGFGSFHISERKSSEGRHPRTGEVIQINTVRNIRFRQGSDLKLRINRKRADNTRLLGDSII